MLKLDKIFYETTIRACMSSFPQFQDDVKQALEEYQNYQWGLTDNETKQKNNYNAHHIALCSNGTKIVGIYSTSQMDICIVTTHRDAVNTAVVMWKSTYDYEKNHVNIDSEFEPCLKTLRRISGQWNRNSNKT